LVLGCGVRRERKLQSTLKRRYQGGSSIKVIAANLYPFFEWKVSYPKYPGEVEKNNRHANEK
jgi:hypothetical protein